MIEFIHYTINWGDTIESIADKFAVDPDDILYSNRRQEFYVGKVLVIPKNKYRSLCKEIPEKNLTYYFKRHLNRIKARKSHY